MNDSQWPEEEANLTYKRWLGLVEDECEDYANDWLARRRHHMHTNVFEHREDHMRYDSELARLMTGE